MVDIIAFGQEGSEAGVVLLPVMFVVELLPDDPSAVSVGMSLDASFTAVAE